MKFKIIYFCLLLTSALFLPLTKALAMPVGTLLYRTSGDNKMYGYNTNDLILSEKGKLAHIYSGHTAIYIGQENGIDYIVEMQPKGAIKVPAKYFVNESLGEKLIGAKIPSQASALQIAKAVLIAKNLADTNLAYDFDFKYQKGPQNGQWTCTGLTEKIYESANISNPTNLNSLEYNPDYYAVDITTDGYDNKNIYNSSGDCFADSLEYSKITRKKNMLIPAPELIGYDVGLEYNGDRYIFLPYTQYLQSTLKDVAVDIPLSSSFSEPEIRGDSPILGLVLKWSLINNPISTVKNLVRGISNSLVAIKEKVFPDNGVVLADNSISDDFSVSQASSSKTTSTKVSSLKSSSTKAVTVKSSTTKATSTKAAVIKVASSTTPKITTAKTFSTTSSNAAISETVVPKTNTVVRTTPKPASTNVISHISTTTVIQRVTTTPIVYPVTSSVSHTTTTPASSHVTSTPAITPTTTTTTETAEPEIIEPEIIPDPVVEPETPIALIAKIYSNGSDDWLEIVNTTAQDFDLATVGYRLEKAKTASDPTLIMRFGDAADGVYPGGTVIKAYGTYLVASDSASEEIKLKADAIATKEPFSWTEDSYTLYLGTASISSDADPDIVDKVGYGMAKYFEGTAPAVALKKGYALERRASATSTIESLAAGGLQEFWPRLFDSNDNGDDFLLVPYDLSVIELETPETKNETNDSNLFVNPAGLNSDNLTELWHFDECYGKVAANELQASGKSPVDLKQPDNWLPGKWGCATSLSANNATTTKGTFSSSLNPNQFSLNFYYRNTGANFNFFLLFSNPASSSQQAYLEFGPYYSTISGFPGPEGRITELVWPVDYLWHQITLVVNRSGGYWSLYLDGVEKYSYHYNGIMPTFDYFAMGNNQVEPVAIDELSFWDRALPETEIRSINLLNQPFNPYTWPIAQKAAKIEHYWSFDENAGFIAKDLIASDDIPIKLEQWDMEGKNSSAVIIGQSIVSTFTDLKVSDLSLSFWWRNTSYPNEGRPHITLNGLSGNIMTLTPTIYNASFVFNNGRETFVPYGESFLPKDNNWHHLALTYDSYRYLLSFYLDGEKKMERQFIKLRTGEEINGLEIAQENWPSSIDELKIWSGTLTAAQVLAEYETLK